MKILFFFITFFDDDGTPPFTTPFFHFLTPFCNVICFSSVVYFVTALTWWWRGLGQRKTCIKQGYRYTRESPSGSPSSSLFLLFFIRLFLIVIVSHLGSSHSLYSCYSHSCIPLSFFQEKHVQTQTNIILYSREQCAILGRCRCNSNERIN